MSDAPRGAYSAVADRQLDDLESTDPALYADILTMCELIFVDTGRARAMSAAVQTAEGIIFRLAVPDRHSYKVLWSSSGPRIEAIFPYA